MKRKLAAIEIVEKIDPIVFVDDSGQEQTADSIEHIQVLAWHLVAQKGQFKIGDKCVYVEIDSVLPEKPEFEFLRRCCYIDKNGFKGFRIKTTRRLGVISQGIAFSMDVLPGDEDSYKVGQEVTDVLEIVKYDPPMPACLGGLAKGNFPSEIPQTDESRIQSVPSILTRHKNERVYASLKMDGCVSYDTRILTDRGSIRIGDIVNKKLDVKVLSFNTMTKNLEYANILEYHKHDLVHDLYKLSYTMNIVGNRMNSIVCTSNHKFLTNDMKWINAENLHVGDFIYRQDKIPTDEMIQVVLGSLLGDGTIVRNGIKRQMSFCNSDKQTEYIEYKIHLLGDLYSSKNVVKSGYTKKQNIVQVNTRINSSISELISSICERNNKKHVTYEWCNLINPLGLAIWYMDDGSLKYRDSNWSPVINIATNGFDEHEVDLLVEMLINKYEVDCKRFSGSAYKGNVIVMSTKGTEKFMSIVAPYICQSMKYKLSRMYENLRCLYENVEKVVCTHNLIGQPILKIEKLDKNIHDHRHMVYDLTIKDNHNYFANNILTHNSSATFYIQDNLFGVCSKGLELQDTPTNSFWNIAKKYGLDKSMREYAKLYGDFAMQGELVGPGIEKNRHGLKNYDLFVFSVYSLKDRKFLDYRDSRQVCDDLKVKFVPVIKEDFVLDVTVEDLEKMATGPDLLNPDKKMEGIVIRPMKESTDIQTGRFSFKVIAPKSLV